MSAAAVLVNRPRSLRRHLSTTVTDKLALLTGLLDEAAESGSVLEVQQLLNL